MENIVNLLSKKGLIVGIANEHSITYGCGERFRELGEELAIANPNSKAEPYVRPLDDSTLYTRIYVN